MKKFKILFSALLLLPLVLINCGDFSKTIDVKSKNVNPKPFTTYNGTEGSSDYELKIYEDDTYVLTVTDKNDGTSNTSAGTVTADGKGTLTLTPNPTPNAPNPPPFTVTVDDNDITDIDGTITFDDGSTKVMPADITDTYTGTDGESDYELDIYEDDTYELTVTDKDDGKTNTSTGTVTDNGDGTLTLTPDKDPDNPFTVTVDDDGITDIEGDITFDDGSTKEEPGAITPTNVHVTSVTLNHSTLALAVGGTETLIATVLPANATNKAVTWTSSHSDHATVSETGHVHAVSAGHAIITVTTADGHHTATCAVHVTEDGVPPEVTGTYTGEDDESEYELDIYDDDTYELTVKDKDDGDEKTSTGTVTDNGDGTLTLTPDADPDKPFTVTVDDDEITDIDGTITYDDGSTKDMPPDVTDTYTGTDKGDPDDPNDDSSYELDIYDDDTYKLTVTDEDGEKKSTGTVEDNGDGTLILTPDEDPDAPFIVTVDDDDITDINGEITFDDGSKKDGPGNIAPPEPDAITYTATEIGGDDAKTSSTGIVFTFDKSVSGLNTGHIIVTNADGEITTGALTGSGKSWTLAITSVVQPGYVYVRVNKSDVEHGQKLVAIVYHNTIPAPTVTVDAVYAQRGVLYKDTPSDNLKNTLMVKLLYDGQSPQMMSRSEYSLIIPDGGLKPPVTTVGVNAQGFTSSFNVTIAARYSAAANGAANATSTTGITFTFDNDIDLVGLTAADITVANGTGSVTKGALSGSGSTRTLGVTVATAGNVTVTINKKLGALPIVEATAKTVAVYKAAPAKTDPTVTWPTGLTATVGQTLADISLASYTNNPAGTFSWTTPTTSVGAAGQRTHNMRFTPTNTDNYNIVTNNVTVTVSAPAPTKTDPTVTWPTGLTATVGQTLADISLTSYTNNPAGTFSWETPTASVGAAGQRTHNMKFTPTNTASYNTVTHGVTITVNPPSPPSGKGGINYVWADDGGGVTIKDGNGGVIPNNSVNVAQGGSLTFKAGEDGYTSVKWTLNGVAVTAGANDEYTFDAAGKPTGSNYIIGLSMVKADKPHFTQITVTITDN